MTGIEMVGLGLALAVMLVGLLGCIVPGLPGTPLVLIAAVGHKLYFGDESVSGAMLLLIVVFALLALAVDWLATAYGAKRMGATWRGVAGAVVGVMVGLFFGPLGVIVGPFIGAGLFEWLGRRPVKESARAAAGAVMGVLVGSVGKCAVCLLMMVLFAVNVIQHATT